MRELVASFDLQLKKAIEIGENASISPISKNFNNIIICGLGGSGIGGKILQDYLRDKINIPLIVNNEYDIPAFVDKNTLAIVSSYSGNTEETLSALNQLLTKDAHVVCITSGGKLKEIATEKNLSIIEIPGGMPPRACLGYSFVQYFYYFKAFGIISEEIITELKNALSYLKTNTLSIEQEALEIAHKIHTKIPVVYSSKKYEGVAIRFRQQINENSKGLAWHNVIPEMNHNEIVGWTAKNNNLVNIYFYDDEDHPQNIIRMDYTSEVANPLVAELVKIKVKGNSLLEKMMYLIHLGDWISVQIAEQKQIDPVEVDVITRLKEKLSSVE